MAKLHRINLVFAITAANEPLYARLSQHIEGATCGVLLNNSSNVVDLLTNSVKDIISKVELKERDHNTHVSVRYFSECKDGEMKERASCKELEVGDEVKFLAEVTATKCPDNEKDWNPVIDVYPMGRQSSLKINLEMQCQCSCAKPGDKDYIEKADLCNKTGDLKCGVCDCYAGFAGNSCECKISEADTISEDGCRETNTSAVCSNRGRCICGKCMCGTQKDPKEKIYGEYCQCTNYECERSGGEICSGHGECECNKCKCSDGWKGKNCACNKGTDSCKNPDTGEICSTHGACECNKCTCTPKYFGKWCEDCQTCSGKCSEFKQCVQCKLFNTGELHSEQCYVACDRYNITVVKEFAEDLNKEQKKCSFFDEKDCLFNFVYEVIEDSNNVSILVKQDLECLEPVNTKGVIFGVIGAVLAIGLLTLVIWKACAILKDQQEYARFLRSRDAAKWSNNENPLYRTARITIQNPLFNLHN
ncbi:integrin beta-PS-like [Penaeus japonicus]|uniref:integrin beta-PS-like n=1 Tax=Penaeus japonicus TaxID=27405 RepID=UPI001C70F68F|nr:integrin beta-PS-like [Penaeus japonicus]